MHDSGAVERICKGCWRTFDDGKPPKAKGRPRTLCDDCKRRRNLKNKRESSRRMYVRANGPPQLRTAPRKVDVSQEVELATREAERMQDAPTRAMLVARIQALGRTVTREGTYTGLIAIAATCLALARRFR